MNQIRECEECFLLINITSANYVMCFMRGCQSFCHLSCLTPPPTSPTDQRIWFCRICRQIPRHFNTILNPNIPLMTPPVFYQFNIPPITPNFDASGLLQTLDDIQRSFLRFHSQPIPDINYWRIVAEANEQLVQCKRRIVVLQKMSRQPTRLSLLSEIEISGIPENDDEDQDLMRIVLSVASLVRFDLKCTDISSVRRVGSKMAYDAYEHVRPILASLCHEEKREEFLKAYKKYKPINTEMLDIKGKVSPIYVNEHLTYHTRQLFQEARRRSRESGYKFCWTRRGFVYIRKDEGTPGIKIDSFADLDEELGEVD